MHIKNTLAVAVSAVVALGCTTMTSVQAQQPPAGEQTSAGAPAPMAALPITKFRARLLDVVDSTLRFQLPDVAEPRLVTLTAEQIKALGAIKGRSFEVAAAERPTPAGIASAVVLRDERGLFAIAERVTEAPLLTQVDRGGVEVQPVTAGPRTFVYETPCKTVYYVPAKVTVDGKTYLLKAYETRAIEIGRMSYELAVRDSTVTVLKECKETYEGPSQMVEYSLVRK